jgi:hypothetical protein
MVKKELTKKPPATVGIAEQPIIYLLPVEWMNI